MTTVMVTSAGRRRYVLEELVGSSQSGDRVIAADMNPLAPALSTPGAESVVIDGNTEGRRADLLLEIVRRKRVDALLSLHDYEAIEISRRADRLSALGCQFIGPSVETSRLTLDKVELADYLKTVDPSLTPPTYHDLRSLGAAAPNSDRWVVKDRWGSASSGLEFLTTDQVVGHASNLPSGKWVAQPLMSGVEYNVDVFRDVGGSVAGSCVKRKWAMRAGETDSATVLIDAPKEVLQAALRSTARLDVTGNLDVDVILKGDGSAVVIDVNPRFGGGYAFSALAGYNAAVGIWQIARKQPVTQLSASRELRASKYVAVAEVFEP